MHICQWCVENKQVRLTSFYRWSWSLFWSLLAQYMLLCWIWQGSCSIERNHGKDYPQCTGDSGWRQPVPSHLVHMYTEQNALKFLPSDLKKNSVTLVLLKPEYNGQTRSRLWLMMSWLHALPNHHHLWYLLCKINKHIGKITYRKLWRPENHLQEHSCEHCAADDLAPH